MKTVDQQYADVLAELRSLGVQLTESSADLEAMRTARTTGQAKAAEYMGILRRWQRATGRMVPSGAFALRPIRPQAPHPPMPDHPPAPFPPMPTHAPPTYPWWSFKPSTPMTGN